MGEIQSGPAAHDAVDATVQTGSRPTINVEIWSDVVCPWCYIGKRRFERAVHELADEIDIDVTYRAYQLDPTASPGKTAPVFDAYAKKFGGPDEARRIIDHVSSIAAEEGIQFRMDRALRANTLLAHRLLWFADQPESPVGQSNMKERLLQAYFTDGLDVSDPDALTDLAVELGFDETAVRSFLHGSAGTTEVADQLLFAVERGITAVPTFVIDDQWAIPGAQDADTFVQVFRKLAAKQAKREEAKREEANSGGVMCADDSCDV